MKHTLENITRIILYKISVNRALLPKSVHTARPLRFGVFEAVSYVISYVTLIPKPCITPWLPLHECIHLIPVFRSRCILSVSALKGLLSSSSIWKVCPLRMISSSPWYKSVWCSCLFWPVLELSGSTERTDSFISEREHFTSDLDSACIAAAIWIIICSWCKNS